jgi:hypothetical protein
MYTDTPVPQEEPAGENPPDGAMIDYIYLKKQKIVTPKFLLVHYIWEGTTVQWHPFTIREYSSNDTLYKIGEVNIPHYWIRPQQNLSAGAPSSSFSLGYEICSFEFATLLSHLCKLYEYSADQTAPWVMPGDYIAILKCRWNF